ncbi:M14 family zinc carboxypeptidase [Vaginella massiliensis]|uniref:M14 family zinc carboxypeptidase n=1 Tax=Vaginella massiliensis TaxID=1816680 RepID=UPI0037511055
MRLNAVELDRKYEQFRLDDIDQKWFRIEDLEKALERLNIPKNIVGHSFLQKPIYKISGGNGPKKVLIWSQMHGNESTGTRAMLDVLNYFGRNKSEILDLLSFDFIPMLNPDGAEFYTRRNVVGIDLNRDFLAKQSVELQVLLDVVEQGDYEFLFNLHDQRTIFNVGHTSETATISFLAPSYDAEQSVNAVRQKTMGVIQYMNKGLEQLIPGKIGRYSAEFYPSSTGDNFTKAGYSCVLFEAGHFLDDYTRNSTRKYNAIALLLGLESIAIQDYNNFDLYDKIPENSQRLLDVILRNVQVKNGEKSVCMDLGLYYEEYIDQNELKTKGVFQEIGDLSRYIGLREYDCKGELYVGESHPFPRFMKAETFRVGNLYFENGLKI